MGILFFPILFYDKDTIVQAILRTQVWKCVSLKIGNAGWQGMRILNFNGYHSTAFKGSCANLCIY